MQHLKNKMLNCSNGTRNILEHISTSLVINITWTSGQREFGLQMQAHLLPTV